MSVFNIANPYDNSSLGSFTYATQDEVTRVLETLTAGKKVVKELPTFQRADILNRVADGVEARKEELAVLITKEIGKTITDSRVEVARTALTARAAADASRATVGEVLQSDAYPPKRNRMGVSIRQPMGIVLAITPFNFPVNLAMHKIAPAFAAGNTVFLKPGPQNYLSSKLLVDICYSAGMPQEALQLCCPDIPLLSEVISGPHVQVINFTGGVAAANAIGSKSGFKKLLFELGGNDPLIVMDDANLANAVKGVITYRFSCSGQRCTAAKRVFVHARVYDQFKAALVEATASLTLGDPLLESTFVGPVVNARAADEVMRRVEAAIKEGASLLAGGKREGNIIHPTILENVSTQSELWSDETFGPVVPLCRFSDVSEVIALVNASQFGLQSGVYTNQLDVIQRLFDELEVGTLAVNDGPGFRAEHFPFGGVKNSGVGREGVKYAMQEMSFVKTLVL